MAIQEKTVNYSKTIPLEGSQKLTIAGTIKSTVLDDMGGANIGARFDITYKVTFADTQSSSNRLMYDFPLGIYAAGWDSEGEPWPAGYDTSVRPYDFELQLKQGSTTGVLYSGTKSIYLESYKDEVLLAKIYTIDYSGNYLILGEFGTVPIHDHKAVILHDTRADSPYGPSEEKYSYYDLSTVIAPSLDRFYRKGWHIKGWSLEAGGAVNYGPGQAIYTKASSGKVSTPDDLYAVWEPDYKPELKSLEVRRVDTEGNVDAAGIYVQVRAMAIAGEDGYPVETIAFSCTGQVKIVDVADAPMTEFAQFQYPILPVSGGGAPRPCKVTATVTDSCGRQATQTVDCTAVYAPPVILSTRYRRTTPSWEQDDGGDCAEVYVKWEVQAIGSQTAPKWVTCSVDGIDEFTCIDFDGMEANGRVRGITTFRISGVNADKAYGYTVKVTDKFTSATVGGTIQSAYFTIDMLGDAYLYQPTADTAPNPDKTYYLKATDPLTGTPVYAERPGEGLSSLDGDYYEATGPRPGHGLVLGGVCKEEGFGCLMPARFTEPVSFMDAVTMPYYCPWPVGAVLQMVDGTDPAKVWPGTAWKKIEGRMLMASGAGYALGATGGAATHALVASNIPSHSHTLASHTHTVGAHAHRLNNHTHTISGGAATTGGGGGHFHGGRRSLAGKTSYGLQAGGGFAGEAAIRPSNTGAASDGQMTSAVANHTHSVPAHSHTCGGASGSTANSAAFNSGGPSTANTGATGSGTAFDTMPPYTVVNTWYRTA